MPAPACGRPWPRRALNPMPRWRQVQPRPTPPATPARATQPRTRCWTPTRQFGLRLRNGAVGLQLGAGNWQALTDATLITITALQIAPVLEDAIDLGLCAGGLPEGEPGLRAAAAGAQPDGAPRRPGRERCRRRARPRVAGCACATTPSPAAARPERTPWSPTMTTLPSPKPEGRRARRDDAAAVRARPRRRHGAPQPAVRAALVGQPAALDARLRGRRGRPRMGPWRCSTAGQAIGDDCEADSATPTDASFATAISPTTRPAVDSRRAPGPARAAGRLAGGLRSDRLTAGRAAARPAASARGAAAPPPAPRSVSRSSPRRAAGWFRSSPPGAPSSAPPPRRRPARRPETRRPACGRRVALVPALATLPTAALTVRGDIATNAAMTIANQDPAGSGTTVRAGGTIALPAANLLTLPGHPGDASRSPHVTGAGRDRGRGLLTAPARHRRTRWQRLPGVRSIGDCGSNCAAAIGEASATASGVALFWIVGDLVLDGPLTLGTAERPLLLVVDGQVRLQPGVSIHGVVVTLAPTLGHERQRRRAHPRRAGRARRRARRRHADDRPRRGACWCGCTAGWGTSPASPAAGATSDLNRKARRP